MPLLDPLLPLRIRTATEHQVSLSVCSEHARGHTTACDLNAALQRSSRQSDSHSYARPLVWCVHSMSPSILVSHTAGRTRSQLLIVVAHAHSAAGAGSQQLGVGLEYASTSALDYCWSIESEDGTRRVEIVQQGVQTGSKVVQVRHSTQTMRQLHPPQGRLRSTLRMYGC